MNTQIQKSIGGFNTADVVKDKLKEIEKENKDRDDAERLRKIAKAKKKGVTAGTPTPGIMKPSDDTIFPYELQGGGIDGILRVTNVSPDYMSFPGVVKWCFDRNAVPVSPRECLANRFAQNGLNDTDKTIFTRGVVLYTVVDGKVVALFDDIAVPNDNVVLKYFGEGIANHGHGDYVLPRSLPIVRNAIDRAIADNRVLSLEGRTNNYTKHSLTSDTDGCDYERVLTPIVGREVALGNVEFLSGRKEKYTTGGIRLLTPQDLNSQNLNDNVVARLFRVGGVDDFGNYLGNVSASSDFDGNGRACGVASAKKNGGVI